MTNSQQPQGLPGHAPGSSPLSLLVNAADNSNGGRGPAASAIAAAAAAPGGGGGGGGGSFQDRSLAESVALRRGLAGEGVGPLHEELMRQKQAESLRQAAALHAQQSNQGAGLLQQLNESQQLSQQLSQHLSQSDIRSALATAQLRQAPQLSNADIMALARSGALPGLGGLLGPGLGGLGGGPAAGFDQRLGDLELQSFEELERRQRLLAQMPGASQFMAQAQAQAQAQQQQQQQQAQAQASEATRQEIEAASTASASVSSAPGSANNAQNSSAMIGMVRSKFSPEAASAGPRPQPPAAGADKKDQRRDPGSVVVPCRARGMPMDHNFKTAYFVIPENVRHGEELICSYFACRNAGVKFRYCSHCKVPVAKRNFRKRHRHGDNDRSKAIVDDDDQSTGEGSVSEDNNDNEMDDIPMQVITEVAEQNPSAMKPPPPAAKEPAAASLPQLQDAIRAANAQQQLSVQAQQQQLNAQVAAQLASQEAAKLQQERAALAASLPPHMSSAFGLQVGNLLSGASGAQNMSILSALAAGGNNSTNVSALPAGLPGLPLGLLAQSANKSGIAAPPPAGEEREKKLEERKGQWLALLANRPQTTDGDTMAAWLMEVLSVSDLTMPITNSEKAPASTSKKHESPEDKDEDEEDDDDDDDEEDDDEADGEQGGEEDADNDEEEEEEDDEDDEEGGEDDDDGEGGDDAEAEGSAKVDGKAEEGGDGEKDNGEKKRPLIQVTGEKGENGQNNSQRSSNAAESGYSVSFAEWRDRKKQKKVMAKKPN